MDRLKQDIEETLVLSGRKRRYLLHLPPDRRPSKPFPLLIALHGRYETGPQMMKQTRFDRVADKGKFALVCPTGVKRSWADGRGISHADVMGIDDIGFVEALIKTAEKKFSADPRRIFLLGFSNGGSMVHRLALDRPQLFSGAAVVSAAIPQSAGDEIKPGVPVPMMFVYGTADPVTPYNGGPMPGGYTAMSVEQVAGIWAERNGCGPRPSVKKRPGPEKGTSVIVSSFDDCDGGKGVKLITITGGGHAWPGAAEGPDGRDSTQTGIGFNLSQAIWDFFHCFI
ncbi:MAG: prolyl oligopeptidase family serine peptidase [Deltaproteobacteria bacterium]|nr:prolyl oligopeptidase family serine peptidase [Deltaproteobacteria bacterium]